MSVQQQTLPSSKVRGPSFFTAGLALYCMFFGAGNLIFPLLLGRSMGESVWFAISGLSLTAVIVPILGLMAMLLFQADTRRFFGRVGKVPGFLLFLFLQLILGPFGVIPRLVTLMHATSKPYMGGISLKNYTLLCAVVLFACSFKRERLVGFLGKILTPVLLASLGVLIFLGLRDGISLQPSSFSAAGSFFHGLLEGYNTMDLIAAFLFATVVLPHFTSAPAKGTDFVDRKALYKRMLLSSLTAAFLLFITYVGLCLVSANHCYKLDPSLPKEQLLSGVAIELMGPVGGAIAAIAVVTACLTTAMTLAAIFAEYLRKDLLKEKISSHAALVITLLLSTLVANLGFEGIAAILGPILQVVYPGLIVLTLLNLFRSLKATA